jgi:glycosyltransferase involved in cell wall biosynthesis
VPTKINEYLAVGRPVVATDLPTLQEFNREHKVLTLSSSNPDDFIAAIQAALLSSDDDDLARRRRELAEMADWGLQMERISEVIEGRLADRNRSL